MDKRTLSLLVDVASPASMETSKRVLKTLKLELPYCPGLALLCIYLSKEFNTERSLLHMFITYLFTRVKSGNQPKCPTTEVMDKENMFLYITDFLPAMELFIVKWKQVEIIILHDEAYLRKTNISYFLLFCALILYTVVLYRS